MNIHNRTDTHIGNRDWRNENAKQNLSTVYSSLNDVGLNGMGWDEIKAKWNKTLIVHRVYLYVECWIYASYAFQLHQIYVVYVFRLGTWALGRTNLLYGTIAIRDRMWISG